MTEYGGIGPAVVNDAELHSMVVSYSRLHPAIPQPTMGFEVDWAARNASMSPVHGDQRSCPAIRRRAAVGITVAMPYTISFARNGQITVSQLLGPDDRRIIEIHPREGRSPVLNRSGTGYVELPACLVTLPAEYDTPTFAMFVLGDLRLNTWIVESGVFVRDVPEGYTGITCALPGHRYPDTYSVGQGVARSFDRIRGHLKIPIELDFSRLPADEHAIVIERDTPMVQWLVARLPVIQLREFPPPPEPVQPSLDSHLALTDRARLKPAAEAVEFDDAYAKVQITLDPPERELLSAINEHPRLGDAILASKGSAARGLRLATELSRLGIVRIANTLPSEERLWEAVYRVGAFHRWVISSASAELKQLMDDRRDVLLRSGGTALDIGSGTGSESIWLTSQGFRVTAVDISETAVDMLRRRSVEAGVDVEAIRGDICDFGLVGEARFVLANDRGCFHHLGSAESRKRYVRTVAAALRPDGLLFLRGYHGDGDSAVRLLEESQGRSVANRFQPINRERLDENFGDLFDLERLIEFPFRTNQIEFPGVAAVLRRHSVG